MKVKNYGTGSYKGLEREGLIQGLLDQAEWEFKSSEKVIPIEEWVEGIHLTGGIFTWEGHEWQREILLSDHPKICCKKGAQIGATAIFILKVLYNLIFGKYPQGAMVIMPTMDSVINYSKSRFAPLIDDNEKIRRLVTATDSATLKKVKKSFLHFVGGQLTSSLEKGLKKSSTALKSTPSDVVLVDELQEISPRALDLAEERLSHSRVQHRFFLSTPAIPDAGIDALYQSSDQRQWFIKCPKCLRECCLETDFPECVKFKDGKAYRACVKCGAELNPSDGRWIVQSPSQSEIHGYWISQLCSPFIDPGEILKAYNDPPHGNLQEVMNSKLGMAYIPSENKLTVSDIYQCSGQEPMLTQHPGPTCAGIDVGKQFHITIAARVKEKVLKVLYVGRFSSIDDISDLCHRFNVRSATADIEPETRVLREWQQSQKFPIWLCDYVSSTSSPSWDEQSKILRINRTEALDAVHQALTMPGRIILPRRCSEMEEFAKEVTSSAKVIEENELGERRYVWHKLGPDHYFHSLAYCLLASHRVGLASIADPVTRLLRELEQQKQDDRVFPCDVIA
jgi:hypothetical protein